MLIRDGRVRKAYIGISMQDVNLHHRVINYHHLENKRGIFVMAVEKNSPAEKAGVKEGDVIVSFNGKPMNSGDDLFRMLGKETISMHTPLTVIRKNSILFSFDVVPLEKAA
jgi:S1-C subfamily serine protease